MRLARGERCSRRGEGWVRRRGGGGRARGRRTVDSRARVGVRRDVRRGGGEIGERDEGERANE